MIVRQRCVYVALAAVMEHADRSVILRRKFVRSIVTMAALTTSVTKSVAKLFEYGIQLLRNDCRSLDMTYSRFLGGLPVLTIYSMVQDMKVSTMLMIMRMEGIRLRSLKAFTPDKLQTR
jgi:hypothetical protein